MVCNVFNDQVVEVAFLRSSRSRSKIIRNTRLK